MFLTFFAGMPDLTAPEKRNHTKYLGVKKRWLTSCLLLTSASRLLKNARRLRIFMSSISRFHSGRQSLKAFLHLL